MEIHGLPDSNLVKIVSAYFSVILDPCNSGQTKSSGAQTLILNRNNTLKVKKNFHSFSGAKTEAIFFETKTI